eukprot:m.179690 g.179690  ORF g.179690 m.179690 type:complete len:124 (-) comp31987_c0_seq2:140-511(-)
MVTTSAITGETAQCSATCAVMLSSATEQTTMRATDQCPTPSFGLGFRILTFVTSTLSGPVASSKEEVMVLQAFRHWRTTTCLFIELSPLYIYNTTYRHDMVSPISASARLSTVHLLFVQCVVL